MKKNTDINNSDFYISSKNIKILLGFSFFLLIFSLFAPLIFTQPFLVDFSDKGPIGDTIGGIMNPFIAIIGVLLTFLAFYIQYEANNKQVNNFKKDFDAQNVRFEKSQFESQFYEMLRLHKENVNEMRIMGWSFLSEIDKYNPETTIIGTSENAVHTNFTHKKIDKITEGRKVFVTMFTELKASFKITKAFLKHIGVSNISDKTIIVFAYRVIFFGVESDFLINHQISNYSEAFEKCRTELKRIRDEISTSSEPQKLIYLPYFYEHPAKHDENLEIKLYINYKAFSGHISRLGHYYRHLYHLVSFVANNKSESISLADKKFFLKIVRGQMSNHEQLMLYYNFIAGLGSNWENENKFFTDFRMIHNLPTKQATFGVSAVEYFKDEIEKKKGTKEPMFEWEE